MWEEEVDETTLLLLFPSPDQGLGPSLLNRVQGRGLRCVFHKGLCEVWFPAGLLWGPAGKVRYRFGERAPFPGMPGTWVDSRSVLRTEGCSSGGPGKEELLSAVGMVAGRDPPLEASKLQVRLRVAQSPEFVRWLRKPQGRL